MELRIREESNEFVNSVLETINDDFLKIPYSIVKKFNQLDNGIYFETENFLYTSYIPYIIAYTFKKDLTIIEYNNENEISQNDLLYIEETLKKNALSNSIIYIDYNSDYGINNQELISLKEIFKKFNYPLLLNNIWHFGIQKHSKKKFEDSFDYIYSIDKNYNFEEGKKYQVE